MDSLELIKRNRLPRRQKGQRVETRLAWFLRVYIGGKQKLIKLADKSDQYRSWTDVEPLIERELSALNNRMECISAQVSLSEFVEQHYTEWVRANKSAPTADGYRKLWSKLSPIIGAVPLANLQTVQVTQVLTAFAKDRLGVRTLSHIKWFLSGVYEYAIANGIVPLNPVPAAKWLLKVERPEKQKEYSLDEIQTMLRILEPLDLRAAVAVSLAYFAALRPAEIRGLQWDDYKGETLSIRRTVWRGTIGETKTEGSTRTVTVIEPLRSLLERLKAQSAGGYILQGPNGRPLNLDSLNVRFLSPVLKSHGVDWQGYYPARRGFSSLLTNTSGNVLNASGHLGHSTPATTLAHYTKASATEINKGLRQIEALATKPETIQ
jgi:integrase